MRRQSYLIDAQTIILCREYIPDVPEGLIPSKRILDLINHHLYNNAEALRNGGKVEINMSDLDDTFEKEVVNWTEMAINLLSNRGYKVNKIESAITIRIAGKEADIQQTDKQQRQ